MDTVITAKPASAAVLPDVRVNGDRLWQSLMDLAKIGATPKGGVCRLTLTDLDRQGRDLVIGWAKEAGLSVTIDKIGNVFMRRAGKNSALPPIMTGSHIGTQPTGGKFDGNFGVLAGLGVSSLSMAASKVRAVRTALALHDLHQWLLANA